MSEHTHLPTPEFRDVLERDVIRAFRREEDIARLRASGRTRRMRAAAVILVSLGIGASAGLASAQIRDRERVDSLLGSMKVDTSLAALMVQLQQARLDEVRRRVQVGVADASTLADAEAHLRVAQTNLQRLRLDVAETKESKQHARDDLNSPLVNGHDYVTDRIRLDAFVAQQAYDAAQAAQAESERRQRVGVGSEFDRFDADSAVAVTRAAIGVLSSKLALRKEFVEKGTPVDTLGRQFAQTRVRMDAYVGQELLKIAQQRVALLEKRHAVGAEDDLELLKARVVLKERELEMAQLAARLKMYR